MANVNRNSQCFSWTLPRGIWTNTPFERDVCTISPRVPSTPSGTSPMTPCLIILLSNNDYITNIYKFIRFYLQQFLLELTRLFCRNRTLTLDSAKSKLPVVYTWSFLENFKNKTSRFNTNQSLYNLYNKQCSPTWAPQQPLVGNLFLFLKEGVELGSFSVSITIL